MQRFHRPALTAAFAACALAAPSFAQDKPHFVGPIGQLKKAESRLAATLESWETEERNGGGIGHSGLGHLDQLVFLPGSEPKGKGVEQVPPPMMDAQERAVIEPVQRRFRQRAHAIETQAFPIQPWQLRGLRAVILDAQVDLAMAELERRGSAGEFPAIVYQTAVESFAKRVRLEVEPGDVRRASDAEALIAEFQQSLEGEVQRMRQRRGTGLEESWLLAFEFRMHVERVRHRWAAGVGQHGGPLTDKPWRVFEYAGWTIERRRSVQGIGIQ